METAVSNLIAAARAFLASKEWADKNPEKLLSSSMSSDEAAETMREHFGKEAALLDAIRALPSEDAAPDDDPEPCSIPLFAQVADWALRLVARICQGRCREHDARYLRGGTLDDKLLADMAFCLRVRDDLIAAGEVEVATGTAAAVWRGLQSYVAYRRWTFPPATVERGAQEA